MLIVLMLNVTASTTQTSKLHGIKFYQMWPHLSSNIKVISLRNLDLNLQTIKQMSISIKITFFQNKGLDLNIFLNPEKTFLTCLSKSLDEKHGLGAKSKTRLSTHLRKSPVECCPWDEHEILIVWKTSWGYPALPGSLY